LIRILWSLWII